MFSWKCWPHAMRQDDYYFNNDQVFSLSQTFLTEDLRMECVPHVTKRPWAPQRFWGDWSVPRIGSERASTSLFSRGLVSLSWVLWTAQAWISPRPGPPPGVGWSHHTPGPSPQSRLVIVPTPQALSRPLTTSPCSARWMLTRYVAGMWLIFNYWIKSVIIDFQMCKLICPIKTLKLLAVLVQVHFAGKKYNLSPFHNCMQID